jgi:tetratricopeptide (TPR) repeat protein
MLFVLMLLLAALSACAPIQPVAESAVDAVHDSGDHDHSLADPAQLGDVDFPVSCTPEAQAAFDQGMKLLHTFWFPPAIESFTTATELDPSCAMGHWGVAMSLWGIPWSPPNQQALVDGWAAVEKAQAVGAATPREEAYIAAVTTFYQDADTVDHRTRTLAYEQAMQQLAADHPEDTEAQIFYALALNITALPTDKSYANQHKAAEILEPIFVEQPNHPGVAHYLIHSYDYPSLAKDGLDAAQRFAEIAPAAPHALHMPAHIFTRMGYWQESIDTNMASANAAQASLPEGAGPAMSSEPALHAMDYMMYAYLQLSQDGAAKELLDGVNAIETVATEGFGAAYALAAVPARYILERGQWADAATLTLHPQTFGWESFPQAEATLVFARGLGAARAGDVEPARQELERLTVLREAIMAIQQTYWVGQADIQIKELEAWIALAESRNDEALALMREAVELEAATEKHPVTPGPIAPAHELLGDMLLTLEQPAEALVEFEAALVTEPNRFRSLYGAARAAELASETETARGYYEALLALSANSDSERAEVAEAEAFLAR